MQTTKQQILTYLAEETRSHQQDYAVFTTSKISETLRISRSAASQYLNELFKEEYLIKISTRPVYYFHKIELEKFYHVKHLALDYMSIDQLFVAIRQQSKVDQDFHQAIGHDGSLNYCINQMKSALAYPDHGLPMILHGQTGSGKAFLVKRMMEFGQNQQIFTNKSKLVHVKVSKEKNYLPLIFGRRDGENGFLAEAQNGLLYIERANDLDMETQEILAELIHTRKYQGQGTSKVQYSNARIVLSVTEDLADTLHPALLQRIPMVIHIPNWNERGDEEKEAFVIKFLKQEARLLKKPVRISIRLFEALSHMRYDFQLNELQKCVKTVCANALSGSKGDTVDCYLYHLPDGQFDGIKKSVHVRSSEALLDVNSLDDSLSKDKLLQLFEKILALFAEYEDNQLSFNDFVDKGYGCMRAYFDFMVFDQHYDDSKILATEKMLDGILLEVKQKSQINLPSNCSYTLARVIVSLKRNDSKMKNWAKKHRKQIQACLLLVKKELYTAYINAMDIARRAEEATEATLSSLDLIFLTLNIHFYNEELGNRDMIGIIIAHGYSTASSIADAANSMLNTHIFEAFDMPLNTRVEEIVKKVNEFILLNPYYRDLILMVDMGSLELIEESIVSDMNIGVINNISTATAINIGLMIQQKRELKNILEEAADQSKSRFKILLHASKEKAIVFTSDAGLKVSERMSNLFRKSLPRKIELKFLEYDYEELALHADHDPLFQKYDVRLMVKPYHLELSKVNSVTLEDIVNSKDIKKVNEALVPFLNREEIEAFNHNLLKNFSLQNVMENLTILNANKLLDFVSDALVKLQKAMHRKFQSKTIVGLYMHVCFLIERLVTKNAIYTYDGVESFAGKEQSFIKDVNSSFKEMLHHYNVEIPISEIALLHDYIINDSLKSEGDF